MDNLDLFQKTQTNGYVTKGALISSCKNYRYTLFRSWDNKKPVCVFIMLNPSTADEKEDDPTIRRCIGFAKGFGCGCLYVLNLFAIRSKDPSLIMEHINPAGPANNYIIEEILLGIPCTRTIVICAWGNKKYSTGRGEELIKRLKQLGIKPKALKLSKDGIPSHPLYLKSNSVLIDL